MKTLKVGRSSTNDIVISSSVVSSQHATLIITSSSDIIIRDLNSTNGTFVNGNRITSDTPLHRGDKILLGNYEFEWESAMNKPEKTIIRPANNFGGNSAGSSNKFTIGRAETAQYRISQPDVSSQHATLVKDSEGNITIIDNNSTNGTFVNGAKITAQRLNAGDIVMISNKYQVNWQSLFPANNAHPTVAKKKSNNTLIIALSIAALLIAGAIGGWYYWNNNAVKILTPEEIYSQYKKSVVMIYQTSAYEATVEGTPLGNYIEGYTRWWVNGEGKIQQGIAESSGTGFFISNDGKILTNKHVVALMDTQKEEAEKIKNALKNYILVTYPGDRTARAVARAIQVDYKVYYLGIALNDTHVKSKDDLIACTTCKIPDSDKVDVAMIQTNNKVTPAEVKMIVNLADTASVKSLAIGKKVYTIGFPLAFAVGDTEVGLEANNQSGEITQERGDITYGHNISIHHGASGSPVFNEEGKFAGIVVSGFADLTQGYNHAIKPQRVNEFLK
ncbi:MAG: FHA domain-containing protein [Muribaculaceae bacterium]|nr:FHA domain-containing protein [Muribaculaceae bacterium]